MVRRIGHAQCVVTHARPGREGHFHRLKVKDGVRKFIETASVVVVQMGDDDRVDIPGPDTDRLQCFDRMAQDRPAPPFRFLRIVAGIDEDGPPAVACNPDEVIHVVRAGMIVVEDEAVRPCAGVALGIFEREDLPDVVAHVTDP